MSGLLRRLAPVADPVLVLVVLVLALQPLWGKPASIAPTWSYVLVVAQSLPLALRRRFPLVVLTVCGVLAMIYGISPLPDPPVPYAVLVAVYSAAAHSRRLGSIIAAVTTAVAIITSLLLDPAADFGDATFLLPVFATAWLLGDSVRRRQELATEMAARTEYLERTREAEASAAVAAERNRIARDMHDVIAHHLSMMVVQAEAGPVVVAADPGRAAEAFDAISAAGKQALTEMRRLLGVLREGEKAPLRPQPGVADIGELVERVRSTGLDVRLDTAGEPATLPQAVDLSVYRLVQEALTNCVRHANADRVNVTLSYENRALTVAVTDNGAGARKAPRPGGHGLVAMRERVALVGGRLEAGPRPDGGWAVRADVPLDRP
ncbi:sensor histidine kinase [Fodinicola acaciae]|uniref:sensor histidine kinase n=1 Tax=Fodinicola acaciae TaxID=2681555 RepID=UPI0013D2F823|nr:sensor histidine kinase [Fodinicola acaciae]